MEITIEVTKNSSSNRYTALAFIEGEYFRTVETKSFAASIIEMGNMLSKRKWIDILSEDNELTITLHHE